MAFLTRISLRVPSVVMLAVVILFGSGAWAATQLPQDLLPNISVPAFAVVTAFPGASADVVDQSVTLPLVASVQGVRGVNTVSSTSSAGLSVELVSFVDGTDAGSAEQGVSSALNRVRGTLPQLAQNPTVEAFDTSQFPILHYAVYSDQALGDLSTSLRQTALAKLRGLTGVADVTETGAPVQQVQVTVDPASLGRHALSMAQVVLALQSAALVQSVGTVTDNGQTIPVKIAGSITSLDQLRAVTIAGAPGAAAPAATAKRPAAPVTVGDIANVAVADVPSSTITRTNGRPSIGLTFTKTPGANTVTVANEIRAALPGIESVIGNNVRFQVMLDSATPITDSISSIVREGLLGALFAVLVIFVFLQSARATLVAAISIPLSLMVALLTLWWQGITLNILTLGGMMVAVGRVVDDAIVVLENISRHAAEGQSRLAATWAGAREIIGAVTASTMTTVAVFLPIAFLSGIAGDFFRPFALTVVTAILASLAVAVTVVPLLASRFLPRHSGRDRVGEFLQRVYVPVIRWAVSHRALALLGAAVIFAGSAALVPHLRVNLLDQSSSPDFPVQVTMPDRSTLAQTDAEAQKVEALIAPVAGVDAYQATVGAQVSQFGPPGIAPVDPTKAQILVLVRAGQYNAVLAAVQSAFSNYGGPAKLATGQAQSESNAANSQVQYTLTSSDPALLATASGRVVTALESVSGLDQVKSDLSQSSPEYQLTPLPALATSGLALPQLAAQVAQALGGQVATQVALPQGRLDVRVQLPAGSADTPAALARLPFVTAEGAVPLSNLVKVELVDGPTGVHRVNGDLTATVTAVITGNDQRAVQSSSDKALHDSLPAGVTSSTGGVFQQLGSVLNQFLLAILAAIGLVYLIMVATFRSLLKPMILLVSIPFAGTGAVVALVATGTSLSLPGMIGLLMLTGIVVTNAIVLLDLVERYRDQGMRVPEALVEGGRRRLRPILMTAVATMLALAPLAFSGTASGGGFISAPLAVVVIGGLFTSTVLTLILVPVLYSMLARFTRARGRDQLREEEAGAT
ncbi:MAG: efflux RND transporter permease subunit [Candidatus Dormibacteria bacterium]